MDENKKGTNLLNDIGAYLKLKLEYAELSFVEKLSLIIGKLMFFGIIGVCVLMFFFLILMLFHALLVEWIGVIWSAVLIEMGFVFLLFILIWIYRQKIIINPIANMIIRMIYDSKNDTDHKKQNNQKNE